MKPALKFHQVDCGYGATTVLSNVTFDAFEGEALAVIGHNGSGKSTLLKSIAGLCSVSGERVTPDAIAYVPQHQSIDLTFPITARDVVALGFAGRLKWFQLLWETASRKRAIEEALDKVGLLDRANIRFGTMSGGQRQRVLIARALVASPKLILMDEPFNGLDQTFRKELVELIVKLKRSGITLVMSTHDPQLAVESCDRALVVANGEVTEMTVEEAVRLADPAASGSLRTRADR